MRSNDAVGAAAAGAATSSSPPCSSLARFDSARLSAALGRFRSGSFLARARRGDGDLKDRVAGRIIRGQYADQGRVWVPKTRRWVWPRLETRRHRLCSELRGAATGVSDNRAPASLAATASARSPCKASFEMPLKSTPDGPLQRPLSIGSHSSGTARLSSGALRKVLAAWIGPREPRFTRWGRLEWPFKETASRGPLGGSLEWSSRVVVSKDRLEGPFRGAGQSGLLEGLTRRAVQRRRFEGSSRGAV